MNILGVVFFQQSSRPLHGLGLPQSPHRDSEVLEVARKLGIGRGKQATDSGNKASHLRAQRASYSVVQ